MTSKVLEDVLIRHGGGAREGQGVRLPQDSEVTVYAALGQESLAIDRVTELELGAEILVVTTRRQERYALAYEDVRGVRIAPPQTSKPAFV